MAAKKPRKTRGRDHPTGPPGPDGKPRKLSMRAQNGVKKARAADNQRKALQMRIKGHTYQEIADALNYAHPSGAQAACDTAMKLVVKEPADTLRKLQLERLDAMLVALWPAIDNPDKCASVGPPPEEGVKNYEQRRLGWEMARHKAMETILKLEARRAKLLGLDAPSKVEASGPGGGAIVTQSTVSLDLSKMTDEDLDRLLEKLPRGDESEG